MKKYKHLFFDMDGTVTRSRSLIADDMRELFERIPDDIIIVSGANSDQIRKQLDGVQREIIILGQNGNQALCNDQELWLKKLETHEREEIFAHIAENEQNRDWDVTDHTDLLQDRICQISYSIFGHNEDVAKKEAFDPKQEKRRALIAKNTCQLVSTEAKIGGTTTIDYIRKNANKGHNVACLIEHFGWDKDECVYFGDALFPGGNDETVVGIIDTIQVANEHDTYEKLLDIYEDTQ